ncbi:MAG: recombinase family protein [Blastochloris sp.]|nr:recombinase family protein [Blastochloris sp.]
MVRKRQRLNPVSGFVKYLRTSDEEVQSPERSQAAQRRDIFQRLSSHQSLAELGEYIDNYTGTSADRKYYQKMLSEARQGKFSHVFASTPDRFGRDDVEALRAIDEMTRLGIKVRFASHPDLDPSDPDDRLYLNILFGMAKRESAITGKRTTGGMLSKLLKGEWAWRAPDGYVNREVKIGELGREEQMQHARYKRWVEIDPQQAQVWRYAWDLLLQDTATLDEICEALFARGYRLRDGRPFIRINKKGRRVSNKQAVSRAFHNWFYAGWVVVENEWANIPPKTLRGNWEPVVSTEEFERGLAILEQRSHKPMPQKKNFYLLQGLLYLQMPGGELVKLTCSRPNSSRTPEGASYYCVPSSSLNFLCSAVDEQIAQFLANIQVSPETIPHIRQAYLADMQQRSLHQYAESQSLAVALERVKEKELNLWRAFTEHGMRAETFEKLAREYQDEQDRIAFALKSIQQENRETIANLDAALTIIGQIGERYRQQDEARQRAILRQIVDRVVVDLRGQVLRLELKSPFIYLHQLVGGAGGEGQVKGKSSRRAGKQTSSRNRTGRSFHVGFCDPNGRSSRETVPNLLPEGGVKVAKPIILYIAYHQRDLNPPMTVQQRNALICAHYADGQTISDLARAYGLTPQRIFQIVNEKVG